MFDYLWDKVSLINDLLYEGNDRTFRRRALAGPGYSFACRYQVKNKVMVSVLLKNVANRDIKDRVGLMPFCCSKIVGNFQNC